jgi:hypothetical protein
MSRDTESKSGAEKPSNLSIIAATTLAAESAAKRFIIKHSIFLAD